MSRDDKNVALDNEKNQRKDITEIHSVLREFQQKSGVFSEETSSYILYMLLKQKDTLQGAIVSSGNGYNYLDILTFFGILIRNIKIIVLVTLIGAATSYMLINSQTRIYETEASLVIVPNFDEESIPRPISDIVIALGTYVQALRSSNLNDAVDLALEDRYSTGEIRRVDTEITPVENSSIIIISVLSENPELAQDYANEIILQITTNNPLPLFEISYRAVGLDAAELPKNASFPDVRFGLVFGIAGSLIIGVMAAFLLESWVKLPRRSQ